MQEILPRITIHAYSKKSDTLKLLEDLSRSNLFLRTTMSVNNGNIESLIDDYKGSKRPSNLIIIEFEENQEPDDFLNSLGNLASVMPSKSKTKVIILGHHDSVRFNKTLVDGGISDYLLYPFTTHDLQKSISRLYMDPNNRRTGNLTTVIGSHGGAGASTIARMLSVALARQTNDPVSLLDLHMGFGSAAYAFSIKNSDHHTSSNYTTSPESIDETLLDRLMIEVPKVSPNFSIYSAPESLTNTWAGADRAIDRIIDLSLSGSSYIIADLPFGWTDGIKHAVTIAKHPLLITSPTYTGLKNTIEFINAFETINKRPIIIINKVGIPGEHQITIDEFTRGAKNIPPSLIVNWNPNLFSKAFAEGIPPNDIDRNDPTILSVNSFIMELMELNDDNSSVGERSLNNNYKEKSSVINKLMAIRNIFGK